MHSPHSVQARRRGPAPPKYGSATSSPGAAFAVPPGVLAVAEEHADRRQVEGVADAHLLGGGLQMDVGRRHRRVEPHAEHPLGLVVVRRQLLLPVGDPAPLPVLEEGGGRHVEGVGVVERAAADSRAGQHQHIAQDVDALDAVEAERRGPQVVAQVPGVLGQFVAGEAAARLQHADPVALLGQPQRGDGAAEARADDDDVVVVAVFLCHLVLRRVGRIQGARGRRRAAPHGARPRGGRSAHPQGLHQPQRTGQERRVLLVVHAQRRVPSAAAAGWRRSAPR